MSNILTHANDIVNNRSEEKERMYGPFFETMERATRIYNEMNPKEQISTVGMYKALVALKLAREAYHHKEDNLLDAVAYMGSMNDYIESNLDAVEEKKPLTKEKKSLTLRASANIHSISFSKDLPLQEIFSETILSIQEDAQKGQEGKIILHNYEGAAPVLAETHFEVDPEDGKCKPITWYNKEILDALNIKYY